MVSLDNASSSERLILFSHSWELIVVEIGNILVNSTSSLQICVMMDNQFAVLCNTNVQLEQMTGLPCVFKHFQSVFRSFKGPSSVPNAEKAGRFNELVERIILIALSTMENVGEAKEEGGDNNIASWDDEPQPL